MKGFGPNVIMLLPVQCWRGQVTLTVTANQDCSVLFSSQPAEAELQKEFDVSLVNLTWSFVNSFTTHRKQGHINKLRKTRMVGCSLWSLSVTILICPVCFGGLNLKSFLPRTKWGLGTHGVCHPDCFYIVKYQLI